MMTPAILMTLTLVVGADRRSLEERSNDAIDHMHRMRAERIASGLEEKYNTHDEEKFRNYLNDRRSEQKRARELASKRSAASKFRYGNKGNFLPHPFYSIWGNMPLVNFNGPPITHYHSHWGCYDPWVRPVRVSYRTRYGWGSYIDHRHWPWY